MWPFSRNKAERKSSAPIFFTNTLSGKKEPFAPLKAGQASLYSCGPTVYSKQHIGNLKAPLFADLVGRVLMDAGYRVRRVMNITDVGHLKSNADEGEDKMELGAAREGVRAQELAERYTKLFLDDIRTINFDTDTLIIPRATGYIKEQIAMVKVLEEKGYTYKIRDGIYFDTSKFSGYGKLGGLSKEREGRIEENQEKRNPQDFALWKLSPAGSKRQQEWDSPWGVGFPGWHIECSAMIKALLGIEIDIHTGGIDHIPTHHNNEIAQSECANGRPLARFWLHEAFVTIADDKISKSLGNDIYLSDITEKGFHPLALRYFFLQSHYRKPISFTWEALAASNEALTRLWRHAREFKEESKGVAVPSETSDRVTTLLRDDLGTPQALALLWETVRDDSIGAKEAWGIIEAADAVLGLSLTEPPFYGRLKDTDLPEDVQRLISERQTARQNGDFKKADELRIHIQERGYDVDDRPEGAMVTRRPS